MFWLTRVWLLYVGMYFGFLLFSLTPWLSYNSAVTVGTIAGWLFVPMLIITGFVIQTRWLNKRFRSDGE